ncbi:MAG TPA: molybdopterin-dependent oxidoreductase [Bacillota bacterium]|jgi:hypothetical protein|nr:molybdopterin-dependent oxidoreductase [Bacillota bacterium]HQD81029.1 molybdopterin-dependent oxidoreductase [Bacillota bacterium]
MRRFVPIIALCLMLVFLGSVCFAEVAKPAGKVVLTVTGDIAITNSDAGFEFDMEMLEGLGVLEYKVKDPWLGNKTYAGIAIAKILEHVGAEDATEVVVVAKDGKKVVIAGEDVAEYEIMLATKDGGKAIGSGLGGPVKLVFPYDDYEGLEEKYPKDDWSWYVVTLEVNAK